MSEAELVKEFTRESGSKIPENPELMNSEEVFFLIKMILDEIMELGATVEEPEVVKQKMIGFINESKNIPKETGSDIELIASQADALVDCYYYILNGASKKGVDLSKVLKIVHEANMNKRIDGKFLRREDGKIIKPEGWEAPDVVKTIREQFTNLE